MSDALESNNVISMQKLVSLDVIKTSGGFAVRARKGEKSPMEGWDPRTNDRTKSDNLIEVIRNNECNFGIHLSGPLVDVDIDSDSPYLMRALDTLLPSCSHVWGRRSRPRTHRLYLLRSADSFDPASHHFLKRIKNIQEAELEVRGGPVSRGEYSIMPGSIHPSGEMYEWNDIGRAKSSPTVVSQEELFGAIRMSAAIAILAPYWQPGARNHLNMAISGMLAKVYYNMGTLDDNLFCLDLGRAQHFVKSLMSVADDDPSDLNSRMNTLTQTWGKAAKGEPVTGGNTIQQITGDTTILSKLYSLLSDSPDIAALDEFLDRFAVWQGPGMVVDMKAYEKNSSHQYMTRQAFVNSYGYYHIDIGGKRRLMTDMLFYMPSAIRVNGVTFDPGQTLLVGSGDCIKLNKWGGFVCPPWDTPVQDFEVHRFIDYLKRIVADNKQKNYEWLVSWLKNIFKNPAAKSKTALVLVGKTGVGKSFLGHEILGGIIGDRHFASTNAVESITRDFNAQFEGKLVIQCDEATNSRQRSIANKLKAFITDDRMKVEPKGVDAYFSPNHSRLIFTSNDEYDAVNVIDGDDDRRYTVFKVSGAEKNNISKYWRPFKEWLTTENFRKIHRWLLDCDVDEELCKIPLMTEAKKRMQQGSVTVFTAWLAAMVSRGHPLSKECHMNWSDAVTDVSNKEIDRTCWPEYVNYTALTRDFSYFVRINHHRKEDFLNEMQIAGRLKECGLTNSGLPRLIRAKTVDQRTQTVVTERIRVYKFPSRKDVARVVAGAMGEEFMEATDENESVSQEPSGPSEF
jgi:hypothetical protein